MTLASTTRRNDYIGNGAVDTYSYTFKIYDETDLLVTVKDTDDIETELTLTTHYTVTGVGESSGGSVALVNGSFNWLDADGDLESGYAITIRRVRAITQETDVRNQGSNFREDIEDEFDKQIMIDQQQQDEIDRSLKFSETSTYDGVSVPDPEAGKVLAWNADADGLENLALTYTSGTFPGTFTAGVDASKAASPSTNDVYIATDTKIVYVCYSAGVWTVTTTLSGTDASKAASPKVGQTYLATDTGKIYVCFSGGSWTFYDPSGIYSIVGLTEKTTPASDDVFVIEDSAASNAKKKIKYSNINPGMPKNYIDGGVISNNSVDVTNDLDISAVECRSDDDSEDIVVSALTKRIDATFVAGTNQGFLDTGTIGASEDLIYIYAIKNPSSGATDLLASKSPTAPTMPSGFTKKRRLGGRRWDGAAWALFSSFGDGRVVDVWYQKSDDADHNVLSAGTQTAFTDVDCGDGGAEVIPTGGFFAYLAIHNRSNSVTSVASYIRRNGDTGAVDQGNIAAYNEPTNATPRHSTMGEIYVDSDGIFEYATIASSELYLYVRGYREVR